MYSSQSFAEIQALLDSISLKPELFINMEQSNITHNISYYAFSKWFQIRNVNGLKFGSIPTKLAIQIYYGMESGYQVNLITYIEHPNLNIKPRPVTLEQIWENLRPEQQEFFLYHLEIFRK